MPIDPEEVTGSLSVVGLGCLQSGGGPAEESAEAVWRVAREERGPGEGSPGEIDRLQEQAR